MRRRRPWQKCCTPLGIGAQWHRPPGTNKGYLNATRLCNPTERRHLRLVYPAHPVSQLRICRRLAYFLANFGERHQSGQAWCLRREWYQWFIILYILCLGPAVDGSYREAKFHDMSSRRRDHAPSSAYSAFPSRLMHSWPPPRAPELANILSRSIHFLRRRIAPASCLREGREEAVTWLAREDTHGQVAGEAHYRIIEGLGSLRVYPGVAVRRHADNEWLPGQGCHTEVEDQRKVATVECQRG